MILSSETPLKLALVNCSAAAKHICYVRTWPLRNKQKSIDLVHDKVTSVLDENMVVRINGGGPIYDYCHAPLKWHDAVYVIKQIACRPVSLTVQTYVHAYSAPGLDAVNELITNLPSNVRWECIPITTGLLAAGGIPSTGSFPLFGPWSIDKLATIARRAFDRDRIRGTSFFKTYPHCYPLLQDELCLRSQTF